MKEILKREIRSRIRDIDWTCNESSPGVIAGRIIREIEEWLGTCTVNDPNLNADLVQYVHDLASAKAAGLPTWYCDAYPQDVSSQWFE